ncbi:cysteine/glutathione ABC transporter permease/ATP-binding protein CydD [Shewanella sp. AS16]|uniref:heme ABC transporter permease/ATP-binding protein CydD n=1 Tax=Shewanella sp. AS16 TaxID=2907625 RepID=UPI001F2F5D68|nr:cysteine/glutathione ABC transporter permease/ATP-binding protein CydD [Shewanella sp. AS16]MCE9685600.1 cysteine/glutathione ABC transporter permease/ATP-binding protein CydD [Shewanella sp. AS16]
MDKPLEKRLSLWLKSQRHACGPYLKLTLLCGLLSGAAMVAQAYLIATVLDGIIMLERPRSDFDAQFLGLLALIAVRAALAYGRERASFNAGVRLRKQIRGAVLARLSVLGPAFIQGKPAGAWASIVLEQVENLQDFYARYLPQVALAGCIPLIILVAVFPLNWAAGLVLLTTAPLIPLFMILVGMGAAEANRNNVRALSRLSGHFLDRLRGLSTLKLFYRADAELKQIADASEEFRGRTMSVLKLAFLSSAVLEFFAAVSIAVLAVYLGFSYLGNLDFGHYDIKISLLTGMFILLLAPEFYQPLRDLGTHYHAKAQAIGAAEALMALLQQPPAAVSTPNAAAAGEPYAGEPMFGDDITISASGLRVHTLDGLCLLGPLSFSLMPGQHLALVGPSGAGKTSLLNALLGFLPYSGSLQINGVELNRLDLEQWRRRIAWLGQEPQLFHGTVRDNVALGRPEMTDECIHELLAQANIADFVAASPMGLAHGIAEEAGGLSVGQAQRIALARALGQGAGLFLLDEPSASLDSHSERLVLAALDEAMQGKACIMVTHRLEHLAQMDKILVLAGGRLVQEGDFDALATAPGVFSDMLTEQEELLDLDGLDDLVPETKIETDVLAAGRGAES